MLRRVDIFLDGTCRPRCVSAISGAGGSSTSTTASPRT